MSVKNPDIPQLDWEVAKLRTAQSVGRLGLTRRRAFWRRLVPLMLMTQVLTGCEALFDLFFPIVRTGTLDTAIVESVEFYRSPPLVTTRRGGALPLEYAEPPVRAIALRPGESVDLDVAISLRFDGDVPSVQVTLDFDPSVLEARGVTIEFLEPVQRFDDNPVVRPIDWRARLRFTAANETTLAVEQLFMQATARRFGEPQSFETLGTDPEPIVAGIFSSRAATLTVARERESALPSFATPARISAGEKHSLAAASDGSVWAWGNNDFGQIDLALELPADRPQRVPVPGVIREVAAGQFHSLALTDSGQVFGWGLGRFGALGPNRLSRAIEPVPGVGDVIRIYAGPNTSYAITAASELFVWGDNREGLLGLANREIIQTPTRVPIGDVVKLAIGREHVLALSGSGAVYGWGQAQFRRLGSGRDVPDREIRLPELAQFDSFVDIAAARDLSFMVNGNGRVFYYGRNTNLMFEDPSTPVRDSNVIPDLFGVERIIGSPYSEAAIVVRRNADGSIDYRVAGSNADGLLTLTDVDYVNVADVPNFTTDPLAFAIGESHALYLQRNGTCGAVWGWGATADGRLGRSGEEASSRPLPQPVPGLGAESCAVLTLSTDNGGRIVSTPTGIDCGDDCELVITPADNVVLEAPTQAPTFVGFGGACANADGSLNTANPLSIAVSDHAFCTATFTPASGNLPPIARFSAGPASALVVGGQVGFDASQSSDPDGTVVAWAWDFDDDGTVDRTTEVTSRTVFTAGPYPVRLTVTDDDGATATTVQQIMIAATNDTPPTAQFSVSPMSPVNVGTQLTLDGSASFDDAGITAWDWDFESDGTFDAAGEIVSFTPLVAGSQTIRLRVTDTAGQTDSATRQITVADVTTFFALRVVLTGPGTVTVTPPGVVLPNTIDCDGNECFVFNLPAGTVVTAEANAQTPAVFAGWSAADCDSVDTDSNTCTVTMTSDRSVNALFQ
ncbi:MAG: PKD domain-containing protein [Pseudomonadota bacterium]